MQEAQTGSPDSSVDETARTPLPDAVRKSHAKKALIKFLFVFFVFFFSNEGDSPPFFCFCCIFVFLVCLVILALSLGSYVLNFAKS